MRRFKEIILIISILFCQINFAQTTSVSGDALANLIVPLSIQGIGGDLDFGEIILTGNIMNVQISPQEGKTFLITGHPGRNVTIAFNSTLIDISEWVGIYGGTIGNILFSPDVVGESGNTISSGSTVPLNSSGEMGINVGGNIDISADQPQGYYYGLFEITVSY